MAILRFNTNGAGNTNVTKAQNPRVDNSIAQAMSEKGRAIMNVGAQAVARNKQYFERANASLESNIYNHLLTSSVSNYDKAYSDRVNKKTDDNGQANYLSLQSDVVKIGNTITKDALSKVKGNPDLRQRLADSLSKYTTNKTMEAGNIQRSEHVDYSRSMLYQSVDTLTKKATTDNYNSIGSYVSDIADIVSKAATDGVISPVQANQISESTRKNITGAVYNTIIAKDPEAALKVLDTKSNAELYITQSERLQLENRSRRGMAVVEEQKKQQARLQQQTYNSQQRVLSAQLEYEMQTTNPALVAEKINRLAEQGQLSEENKFKLLKQTTIQRNNNNNEQEQFAKIDDSIKNEIPDASISSSSWNKKYAQEVALYSDKNTGKPPTFSAKTGIVSKYTAPVASYQKELEYNMLQGSPKDIAESSRAYGILMQSNPTVLKGMDDNIRDKAEHINFLMSNSNLSPAQAVAQVKSYQDVTDDVRKDRSLEFNKFDKLNDANLDSTIRDQLTIDKGFFSFFESSTSVSPDFEDTYRELAKMSYIRTGDMDVALRSATNQMKQVYGVSNINGTKELMAYPPEKYVPKEQLEQAFSSLARMKGAGNFKIVSDALTKADPSNLSYSFVKLLETDDGTIEMPVLNEETGEILRWKPKLK